MKRSLIFLLAAGPLFVFGQRPDLPELMGRRTVDVSEANIGVGSAIWK